MNIRNFNIYFHTHTISGIIISAVLYVIFFAGSFSFFKNEITSWENNSSVQIHKNATVDLNRILDSLDLKHDLANRNISFSLSPKSANIGVQISGSKDTLADDQAKERTYIQANKTTFEITDYKRSYSLGEFLYRLHFLAQIKYPYGYTLAGLVSFIFLFAIITGVLLHWQKIASNFYLFRPWAKIKTLWTDAHTALGIIGLPYQFIFAVSGAYFLINYFFVNPTTHFFYNGDSEALYKDMGYNDEKEYDLQNKPLAEPLDLNAYFHQTQERWKTANISEMQIQNYGDQSAHLIVNGSLNRNERFTSTGKIIYELQNTAVIEEKTPQSQASYRDTLRDWLYKLHFGDYGGYALKIFYFLVGIAGCFVIISGVMIWLVGRDKKNIPRKKRIFNEWLVNIYLSVCLSMYPITAAIFIAVKVFHPMGRSSIYSFYFWGWLLLAVFFAVRNNNYKTNRDTLLLGSLIGLCIPVANGLVSGNWMWVSLAHGARDILLIDVFWTALSLATLCAWYLLIRKNKKARIASAKSS